MNNHLISVLVCLLTAVAVARGVVDMEDADLRNATSADLEWFRQLVATTASNRMDFGWLAGSKELQVNGIPALPVHVFKTVEIDKAIRDEVWQCLRLAHAPTGTVEWKALCYWIVLFRTDDTDSSVRLTCIGGDIVEVWRSPDEREGEKGACIRLQIPRLSYVILPLVQMRRRTEPAPRHVPSKAAADGDL